MKIKLTDTAIKALPSPEHGNRITYDTELPGFGIRVTANGTKAFVLNYFLGPFERRHTIGRFPTWSAVAAREKAKALRRDIDSGADPLAEKKAARVAPTIGDLYDRYKSDHLAKKAARSQVDEKAMFTAYILPELGRYTVAAVTHSHVDALHRMISDDKPVRANRVIEVLRCAFNLAIRWHWRPDNPADGVRRNPEQPRKRYLNEDELAKLVKALDRHPERTSADAIWLMVLTGARKSEVLGATWSEFELTPDRATWVKPASRTKQRQAHYLPLSPQAAALLIARRKHSHSDYVFPGTDGKPLQDVRRTWATACNAASISDIRLHDLRHTFASLVVSQGHSLPVVGSLLGHTQAQTTMRYAHLADDKLRTATSEIGRLLRPSSPMDR